MINTKIKANLYRTLNRTLTTLSTAHDQLSGESAREPGPYPARLEEIAEMIGRAYCQICGCYECAGHNNGKQERPE